MFRRSDPASVPSIGVVDLTKPHDACLKCGRPTPLGVSLCDNDNPGHIKSPSTTQVHATILIGVIVGIGLLLLLFRFGSAGIGPFPSTLSGTSTRADGGIDVAVTVTNNGTRPAGASCRISNSAAQDFRDYVFFTQPIQPGETKTFTQTMPPPPPDSGTTLSPVNLVVKCS
jgi:hypothetical protein